jgi:uncharacterized protein
MNQILLPLEILPFFFLVAVLYTSVGQGGASGYLALFAIFGIASPAVPPVTLALNCIAASIGFFIFRRASFFPGKILLPFVITSVPAAFIGGLIPIGYTTFTWLMGISLLIASLMTLFFRKSDVEQKSLLPVDTLMAYGLGAGIGFLSGMTGIGGGIFLAPAVLVLKWTTVKQAAALSTAFIVLNSIGGVGGHLVRGNLDFNALFILSLAVITGSILGSLTGTYKLNDKQLRVILGILLFGAGMRILIW